MPHDRSMNATPQPYPLLIECVARERADRLVRRALALHEPHRQHAAAALAADYVKRHQARPQPVDDRAPRSAAPIIRDSSAATVVPVEIAPGAGAAAP